MSCERLKWMAHDHVITGVQNLISEANLVVDIVDQAVISSINCFDDLSSKLGRQPHKFT